MASFALQASLVACSTALCPCLPSACPDRQTDSASSLPGFISLSLSPSISPAISQVLPVYALTTAAGSHSAASVIQHALRKNIKPDLARLVGCAGMVARLRGCCSHVRVLGMEQCHGCWLAGRVVTAPGRCSSSYRRALQRMSLQRALSGGEEQEAAAGEGEEAAQSVAQEGSHRSGEAAQQAAQQAAPAEAQLELQPAAGWGGPPSLARHSAPLPVLLHSLSTYPSLPLPAGAPLAVRPSPGVASGGAGGSGALSSPFAGPSLDSEALAAVAAAAAAPAAGEVEEEGQRSITRLMGEHGCCQRMGAANRGSACGVRQGAL